jgi:hypothetical protein
MPLVIAAATSGQTTLQATDAVTATITLPSATDTLVGKTTPSFTTTIGVGNATPSASGAGITFPATQSASTNANTLDDYEEGTWTTTLTGVNLTGLSLTNAYYTKVGRLVTISATIACTVTSSNILTYAVMSGTPFTAGVLTAGSALLNNATKSGTSQIAGSTAYAFFPAASAAVAGAEVIYLSITYIV